MKRRELVPCASCARHVRSHELACPFCGAAREPGGTSPARGIPRGSSRAAAFALLAVTTAGCAASHDRDDEPALEAGASADASQSRDAATIQDAAAPQDAAVIKDAAATDAAALADASDAARDAAPIPGVDAALDGSSQDAFVPIPIYGGVFPDPRTRAKV